MTKSSINVDGNYGFAPMAIKVGIPALIKITKETGVVILTISNTHHFAALWPEVETLAMRGLVAMACVSYTPMVAPFGAKKALYGTNPLSLSLIFIVFT